MYAFPSLFCLHRLNVLLVFIPLWAFSTYLNWKHGKVSLFRVESSIVYYLIRSMVLIYFLNSYTWHGNLWQGWVVPLSHTWDLGMLNWVWVGYTSPKTLIKNTWILIPIKHLYLITIWIFTHGYLNQNQAQSFFLKGFFL